MIQSYKGIVFALKYKRVRNLNNANDTFTDTVYWLYIIITIRLATLMQYSNFDIQISPMPRVPADVLLSNVVY